MQELMQSLTDSIQSNMREEDIMNNKGEFIALIESITREGFKKELLLSKLENSDFYTAPASTKFHGAYKGGLVDHCLAVYHNMCCLVKMKGMENEISEETIKIVALFHDLAKRNFYETYYQNKKIYCEDGDKRDENGRFTWKSVSAYKVRESEERFVFGNHEQTSEYMLRQFIPLTVEESTAILHHHGSMSWDSAKDDIGLIWDRYPLSLLLYQADCLAAYIDKA